MGATTSPEGAVELLASRLRWQRERIDPTEGWLETWNQTSDWEREVYRTLVRDLLRYSDLLQVAARLYHSPATT
jgi:hypothetical protein